MSDGTPYERPWPETVPLAPFPKSTTIVIVALSFVLLAAGIGLIVEASHVNEEGARLRKNIGIKP